MLYATNFKKKGLKQQNVKKKKDLFITRDTIFLNSLSAFLFQLLYITYKRLAKDF